MPFRRGAPAGLRSVGAMDPIVSRRLSLWLRTLGRSGVVTAEQMNDVIRLCTDNEYAMATRVLNKLPQAVMMMIEIVRGMILIATINF